LKIFNIEKQIGDGGGTQRPRIKTWRGRDLEADRIEINWLNNGDTKKGTN
jgi:hypothetical protein